MTLQELADKQAVELEVIWGDKSFSLQTKVEGKSESGILLRPYVVKDQEITVNQEMAKSFVFNIYAIDEMPTTSIDFVTNSVTEDDVWYSLNGTKVEKPTKGVYIKNGKKYAIK